MKTNFYIDGFNLYYRALKDTPFKWLDLRKLAETLFPRDTVNQICYFTAKIDARPNDPGQPQRQQAYLRVLHTLPGFQVHYGLFKTRIKNRPLAFPLEGLPEYVDVLNTEEKGSDVNLATRLLADGFRCVYEQAVVISKDSDLASAIRCFRDDLNLQICVVNPDRRRPIQRPLREAATFVKTIRRHHLENCQFPEELTDESGLINRPSEWKK